MTLGRTVQLAVAALCALFALLDLATLATALSWLHWTEHVPLELFWLVRGAGWSVAAVLLVQGRRAGVWLGAALLASVPLVYLLPFVDHAENQFMRRSWSTLALVLLLALGRRTEQG